MPTNNPTPTTTPADGPASASILASASASESESESESAEGVAPGRAEATAASDSVMAAITQAVAEGQSGDSASARDKLLSLWSTIGVTGDPLHRCTLAHYLADLYDDPAHALAWDIRALDAADAITEQRTQSHHPDLHIAGFYPSLHLNLADNYRRLSSFEAATTHLTAAKAQAHHLPQDTYGNLLRTAIHDLATAITHQNTSPRPTAPSPNS